MALDSPVRLTDLSHGAGCACKIGPGQLRDVLAQLPAQVDPALLVGSETCDDAGVYRISEEMALVQTVDFFTPIVDDPRDFGRIAAANALSDVYAMGAQPLTALNLVAYSVDSLGPGILAAILEGGAEVAAEAGVPIVGGHSIDDPEPKYGMAVTGVVHPRQVVRNSTGKPGDVLFLTKPIGGGAVTTAAKRGMADDEIVRRCTRVMTTLNAAAAQAATAVGASAMTDVTGFGLLGHLHELAHAGGSAARVEADAVPAIEGALELLAAGALAGGSRRNREWLEPQVNFAAPVPEHVRALLCDAMTSGGLLVATPPARAAEMERALADAAPQSARIGTLQKGPAGRIAVV
ncbi:MAG TPA: selenide, water dikinase SelD [Solirubrobacterales bacterium]|nr:selenide, water dikinase SelD [Solirubrobacterales bacterium]